eukprot:5327752-Lingulodinium_polyedra.AAC.1
MALRRLSTPGTDLTFLAFGERSRSWFGLRAASGLAVRRTSAVPRGLACGAKALRTAAAAAAIRPMPAR